MAFRVYVDDGTTIYELDTEDIQIDASYSVADIKDIAARNDSIKSITFKGTKNNNAVFGNMFFANRTTNTSLPNKLGFNYSPIRQVTITVYEDGVLIFTGFLKVNDATVGIDNSGYYEALVQSSLTNMRDALKSKYLTDVDFTDLKHRYNITNISNSWDTSIETFNASTSSYINKTFQKGTGYVYPFVDHGVTFLDASGGTLNVNLNPNKIHGLNFRPAVFVAECFKRMFNQSNLNLTYEIKGDSSFIDKFNSLLILNADEKMIYKLSGFNLLFVKTDDETQSGSFYSFKYGIKNVSFQTFPTIPPNTISSLISRSGSSSTLLKVDRNFITDAYVTTHFDYVNNPYPQELVLKMQLVEKDDTSTLWSVIAENSIKVAAGASMSNFDINISVGERQFKEGYQLALQVVSSYNTPIVIPMGPVGPQDTTFLISSASISFPKDNSTLIKAETQLNTSDFDVIAPTAPENIKQYDFIMDIVRLFDLYIYTDKDNPRHIIFHQYDDYWAFASPALLNATALDWTMKVDRSTPLKYISNLSIPKTYLFTYKDDGDRLNSEYKKKWGKTYGSFTFNDSYGVTEEKKISINFSPTPITSYADTGRFHPALYIVDSGNKKPLKTNIRLLYYNGLMDCNEYTIAKDKFTTAWTTEDLGSFTEYANVSSYFYVNGKPVEDLNFGRPAELYYTADPDYFNIPTAYQKYYLNQTSELTNANLYTLELSIYLNEVDIANLDLRVPVFIDNGTWGHGYYKVLSIDRENKSKPSKVLLQKIVIGTDR